MCTAALQATWTRGYWVLDTGTECFHGWHLVFAMTVGLISIAVFVIGIPAASLAVLAWKLYVDGSDLDDPDLVHSVGFLYRSYNYRHLTTPLY